MLTLAAGLTLATVGLIATPLDQDLDTTAAGAQSLSPTLQTQGVAFAGTPAVGALFKHQRRRARGALLQRERGG